MKVDEGKGSKPRRVVIRGINLKDSENGTKADPGFRKEDGDKMGVEVQVTVKYSLLKQYIRVETK